MNTSPQLPPRVITRRANTYPPAQPPPRIQLPPLPLTQLQRGEVYWLKVKSLRNGESRVMKAQILQVTRRERKHLWLCVQEEGYWARSGRSQIVEREIRLDRTLIADDPGPTTWKENLWEKVYGYLDWVGL